MCNIHSGSHDARSVEFIEDLPTIWLDGLKEDMAIVESMLMQALDNIHDSHSLPSTVTLSVRYKVIPEINITILRK